MSNKENVDLHFFVGSIQIKLDVLILAIFSGSDLRLSDVFSGL